MPTARLLPVLLSALVAVAPPAAAAAVEIVWDANGRFERSFSVAPGSFVELCGALSKGRSVGWRFDADRALDFNVHYHEGRDVHYPSRLNGARRGSGTLEVGVEQDHCWMWTRRARRGAATLRVVLQR